MMPAPTSPSTPEQIALGLLQTPTAPSGQPFPRSAGELAALILNPLGANAPWSYPEPPDPFCSGVSIKFHPLRHTQQHHHPRFYSEMSELIVDAILTTINSPAACILAGVDTVMDRAGYERETTAPQLLREFETAKKAADPNTAMTEFLSTNWRIAA